MGLIRKFDVKRQIFWKVHFICCGQRIRDKNYHKKKIDSIFNKNTFLILLKIIDKLYGRCYKKLLNICNKNIFSIMEEIWASDTKKIDLVVFWNEFVIISFEIKCNFVGQSYQAVGYILFCAKKWRSERKRKKTETYIFR